MFLFWGLLCLSSFLGVMSQTLTQSSSEIKKPGESVTMSCVGSGYTYSTYYINWVQQIPGRGLTWIGRIYPGNGGTDYSSSYKGRATITSDKSRSTSYLQINNLKVEDTATYYCASGYYFDVWGPGTYVTVTAVTRGPTVFPMMPCCDILPSVTEVTIGCLSTAYVPEPVEVTWNSGSITTGIKNMRGVRTANGNYISTSLLTISASDFKTNHYTCNVNHQATGEKVNKDIGTCKVASNPPTVELVQASCGETGLVDLVCLIYGHSPDDIKIQWLLNGKTTSISPTNSTPYKDNEGKFLSRSQVTVPKDDWNSGDTYTCRVSHPPTATRNEDSIHRCQESPASLPKVVLHPPFPRDILITKQPKLICEVSKLSTTESLNFKWTRGDGKRAQAFKSDPVLQFDGTFTVTNSLKISLPDWETGKPFTCVVEHSDLPGPVQKTIQKRDEQTTEPTVHVFPPPHEELAKYEFVHLTCMLQKYSPRDLQVQWERNGEVMEDDKYINTDHILDEDTETYFMYSTALISRSDWNRGVTYTCSGLLGKITSKDIKKIRGK